MVKILLLDFDEGMNRFLREICSQLDEVCVLQDTLPERKAQTEDWLEYDYCLLHLDDSIPLDSRKISDVVRSYNKKRKGAERAEAHSCRITTARESYDIPYEDILFIESERKKSIIHTKGDRIELAKPLCRLRENLPRKRFVQTHRSFIVNLGNASHVDKTKDPWEVSFLPSKGIAFISRGYRKEFTTNMEAFLNTDRPALQGEERRRQ